MTRVHRSCCAVAMLVAWCPAALAEIHTQGTDRNVVHNTKCPQWGYDESTSDPRILGKYSKAELALLHRACDHLGLADDAAYHYKSHTMNGTPIDVIDVSLGTDGEIDYTRSINLPTPHGSLKGLFFEGAWGPDSLICLTKRRWSALPIGTFLGRDPRDRLVPADPSNEATCDAIIGKAYEGLNIVAVEGFLDSDPALDQRGSGEKCRDAKSALIKWAVKRSKDPLPSPVLLFSKSGYIDQGLYQWCKSPQCNNQDSFFSTTEGFFTERPEDQYDPIEPPQPGYHSRRDLYLGAVFSNDTHNFLSRMNQSLPVGQVPDTLRDFGDEVVRLTTYEAAPDDYFTTTIPPGGDYNHLRWNEGWIYSPKVDRSKWSPNNGKVYGDFPIQLCSYVNKHVTPNKHLTTTLPPPSSDWEFIRLEGYVVGVAGMTKPADCARPAGCTGSCSASSSSAGPSPLGLLLLVLAALLRRRR